MPEFSGRRRGRQQQGHGIGRALLLPALHAQQALGYAYAIIGSVGPAGLRTIRAIAIQGRRPASTAEC
jgi:hypothetical protein